jgi:Ca-activated chloride channel homolog
MPTSLPSAAAHVHASPAPEIPTRGAEVVTRDGRSLPLVSAKLHADAQGGIARMVLQQRFENHHNETLHVTYRMPLPAEGAVSGYAFQIAGRTITGRVDRKRAARKQFERAVASGKTAALLEQDRADIFTQSIGNLPAGEALTAWIAVDVKLGWLPEGEWELRFPTVIGPRYVGTAETAADAQATAIETSAAGVAARIQIEVKIGDAILGGRTAASPSHALRVGDDGLVELRDVAGARLDRDIVVRWPVAGPAVGLALAVARPARELEGRPEGDAAFGLLTIVPPARAAKARPMVRDLIVLVDTSGSMGGGPLDKAKQVVALLIDSLGDDDRVELIEFSSQPRRYKPGAVAATRGEKQAAIRWLRGLQAGGGTEMRSAVIEAMRALRPGSQRQVVLATDGYIGGEEQIVQQLHRDLPRSCRLHFLGVGSSVNRTLSTSVARAGRGAEVLCDLDEDAERAAKRIIDRTRMPMLTNVTLAGSALIAQAPELLPDVFEASPFVAAVQLRAGELVVRGELAHGAWEQRLDVRACRAGEGNQAIVGLFGREHVADLEARGFAGEGTDAELERTGLAFQIATRLTSWIAIDEARTVTGPSRHDNMPQALPYGTTAAAFGLRAHGAMPSLVNTTLGGFSQELRLEQSLDAPHEFDMGESPRFSLGDSDDDDDDDVEEYVDAFAPASFGVDAMVGTSAGRLKGAPQDRAATGAPKPVLPATTRSIADKTAPDAKERKKAEAAPRDELERELRRRGSSPSGAFELERASKRPQAPEPEPAKEVDASAPEELADVRAPGHAPALHKDQAPLQLAVAKAVAAARRTGLAKTARSRRTLRLPVLLLWLILASVIAALLWWFVA